MKKVLLAVTVVVVVLLANIWLYASPRQSSRPQSAKPQQVHQVSFKPIALLAPTTSSTPTVGMPSVTPSTILVNTPTTVTIMVQITPAPLLNSVNLLRINGASSTVVGTLHDDGLSGD